MTSPATPDDFSRHVEAVWARLREEGRVNLPPDETPYSRQFEGLYALVNRDIPCSKNELAVALIHMEHRTPPGPGTIFGTDITDLRVEGRWAVVKAYRGRWLRLGDYATEAEARRVAVDQMGRVMPPL